MNSDQIAIVAASVSLVSLFVTFFSWRIQSRADSRSFINDLIREYRSIEMYYAVKQLWDLYKISGETEHDLVRIYLAQHSKEEKRARKRSNRTVEHLQTTIHHSRRLVVLYYLNVAQIVKRRLVNTDDFFNMWTESDLSILTKIVLPIQKALLSEYKIHDRDEVGLALADLVERAKRFHESKSKRKYGKTSVYLSLGTFSN